MGDATALQIQGKFTCLAFPDHSNRTDRMETTQTHLRSNPCSTLAWSKAQKAVTSPAPQKPSACLHTVVSGTLQPGLHHHTLLHPLPTGKSPAAGWPLSTGLVLLHEMNCCGVGVGETGCAPGGAAARGSLGTAGSSQQLSSQPAWLSRLCTAAPQDCWIWPFFSCQAAAALPAPQTPPALSACTFTLCVTHWDLS